MGIHNYEERYKGVIEYLNRSKISERNKQLILSFNEALILKNVTKPRLMRCMGTIKQTAEFLKKDLDQANINDIKRLVSSIQQSKYTAWTKRTYKCIIKQF